MEDSSGGESPSENNLPLASLKKLKLNQIKKSKTQSIYSSLAQEMEITEKEDQNKSIEESDSTKRIIEKPNLGQSHEKVVLYKKKNDLGPYIITVQNRDTDIKLGNYHRMAIVQLLIDQKFKELKASKDKVRIKYS